MVQAFVDDSKQDGEVLVLAGWLAGADAWSEFSREWAELLTIRPPWRSLKMAEVMRSGGDASYERVIHHYRVIEKYVTSGICVAVPIRHLAKVVRELEFPKQLQNPYFLATRAIITTVCKNIKELGFDEPVDFVFDDQSEKSIILKAWTAFKENMDSEYKPFVGETPIFRCDERFLPLQAADLFAWWIRKRFVNQRTVLNDAFPFPWGQTRGGPTILFTEYDECGIRRQLESDRDAMVREA